MSKSIPLRALVNRKLFAEMPDTPFSVFFKEGSAVTMLYPYIENNRIYTVIDYWMNPREDIMIKFHELDHYIKFVEGGMYVSHFIKPS